MPRRRRPRWPRLLLLAVLVWLVVRYGGDEPRVLGTFNIRAFPDVHTDPDEVAEAIAALNADAFAVQEIRDPDAFRRVLADASAWSDRDYRAALVPYCHPFRNQPLYLGVVHDVRRLSLVHQRPLSGADRCAVDQPSGMLATLHGDDGRDFALASVHMRAGGSDDAHAQRRRQWAWLTAALPRLTRELGAPVIVAGDFNSTGYLQDDDERRFIDETVAAHDLQLPTGSLDCSEYWEPRPGRFIVSLLDHVLAPAALELSEPEVLGMCAELGCITQNHVPPGFDTVSDHCPVRITLLPE